MFYKNDLEQVQRMIHTAVTKQNGLCVRPLVKNNAKTVEFYFLPWYNVIIPVISVTFTKAKAAPGRLFKGVAVSIS
mgnify:CR=1 FL=1